MAKATATTTSATVAKPIAFWKTSEIMAHAEGGKSQKEEALKELDRRIAKRNTAGQSLIPAIVESRNKLAKDCGLSEIPVPVYAAKSVLPSDPKKIADMIRATGVDITEVITALAS